MAKQYILHKTFRDSSGNFYFARTAPYYEGELPEKITKDPTKVTVIDVETQVAVSKPINNSPEVVHLNPNLDNAPVVIDSNFVKGTPEIVSRLNVNTASLEELKNTKGIGEKTATLIISGRPYTDATELSTKVKPPFGKNWADFNFVYNTEQPS